MSDFGDWFRSVPYFTRYWLVSTVGLTLFGRFGLLKPSTLILHWESVKNFQVWRPLTFNMLEEYLMENPHIRSVESKKKVYVKFVNRSTYMINLCWVDYNGRLSLYKSLRPNESVDIDTYETHPWVAFEIDLKQKMNVGANYVYFPIAPQDEDEQEQNPSIIVPIIPDERRKVVTIAPPLTNLKDKCISIIQCLLVSYKIDINKVNLPKTVIEMVKAAPRPYNMIKYFHRR